jgi:hypothetical protein
MRLMSINNAKYQNTSTKIQINSKLQYPNLKMVLKDRFERLTSHSTGFGGGH